MYKFLHAADIHLDSPLIGLDRYESAPADIMRGATRRAFENLVETAIAEQVAFVLLAGDLYDGNWKDYRTGLFFVDQMACLCEAEIPVFMVSGNHDAVSQITKHLHLPDNVHLFRTARPETRFIDRYGVAIHGQGFENREVSDDLAAAFPAAETGLLNIGLLHTSLDGRPGHGVYAPSSRQVLTRKGYQYWALGHVHRRETISREPWIVYPGNLQGRHARELGPKGCTVVTVDSDTIVSAETFPVDVLRWVKCDVPIDDIARPDDMLALVREALMDAVRPAGSLPVAARVEITGTTSFHNVISGGLDHWTQEIRALAASISFTEVWVEKVVFSIGQPTDLEAIPEDTPLGSLLRSFEAPVEDPEEIDALQAAMNDIRAVLPPELVNEDGSENIFSPENTERLRAEARALLFAKILNAGITA